MHSVGGEEGLLKRLALISSSSLIALALVLPVSAQSPEQSPAPSPAPSQPSQGSIFRSGASLVALNVTVSDGKRLIPGLVQDDFSVYEDGVLQHVQFFESHEVPIDLILLIDTSASMADKMEVVHDAAIGFLRTLRDRDRGAVVTFGDNVNIVQALSSDKVVLEQAVRRMAERARE